MSGLQEAGETKRSRIMKKIRAKVSFSSPKGFRVMYRNNCRIWTLSQLFAKMAKKIVAADGKCIDIEITMKEVK